MIFEKNSNLISQFQKTALIFASAFQQVGVLAQLVEQWTENPCVPGSIPGDTTRNPGNRKIPGFCFLDGILVIGILVIGILVIGILVIGALRSWK